MSQSSTVRRLVSVGAPVGTLRTGEITSEHGQNSTRTEQISSLAYQPRQLSTRTK